MKDIGERLAKIEAHNIDIKEDLNYIKNNMVSKSTINILKWAMGIIGGLAVTALTTAFKLTGGH